MQSLETFDIRKFTDRLEPAKGKDRYICPACNGNNLTFDPENGAYQCWNYPDDKQHQAEIREAIRPLKEALAESGGDRVVHHRKPQPSPQQRAKNDKNGKPLPATLPDAIALVAARGTQAPRFTATDYHGWQREQVYQYGPDLRVVRYERDDPAKPKGREKTFRQWHQSEGRWVMGKGDRPWPAYRIDDAIAGAQADRTKNAVLVLEGEQCVDCLRDRAGLAAITLQGSAWDSKGITALSERLASEGLMAIVIPDNDGTGHSKADKLAQSFAADRVPCLVIDPLAICPDLADKGDVVDILDRMSAPDFIQRLEAEIHRAADAQRRAAVENDPVYQLRLAVADYVDEVDGFAKALKASEICSNHGLPKQTLEQLANELLAARQQSAEPARVLSIAELMARESSALEFLVDGWLPRRDTALITGESGACKTQLAYDLAFAIGTGGKWLNAQCRQGRVLIVNSDMSVAQTVRYLLARGVRPGDDSIDVMDTDNRKWTVKDQATLERFLEQGRYDLVIFDSVRSLICNVTGIEEKSELIGGWIQRFSSLCARYGASAIWIHHDSKSQENKGVCKASGSTAIVASVSYHWQLAKVSEDPNNTDRRLNVYKARELEPGSYEITHLPENNSFAYHGRVGESPESVKQNESLGASIKALLNERPGVWHEGRELRDRLGTDSAYTILRRLADRREIECRYNSKRSKSYRVPALDGGDQSGALCQGFEATPPPPTLSLGSVSKESESIAVQELQTANTFANTLLTLANTVTPVSTPVSSPNPLPCNASDALLTGLGEVERGGGDRTPENGSNVPIGEIAPDAIAPVVEAPQPIAPSWPPQVGDRVWHSCEWGPQYVGIVRINAVVTEGDRTVYLFQHEQNGMGGRSAIGNLSPLP